MLLTTKGRFTLGLREAEQSLKTGLFCYDESSPPAHPAPARFSPKILTPGRELFSRAQPESRLEQGRC